MPKTNLTVIDVVWNTIQKRLVAASNLIGKNRDRFSPWFFGIALVIYVALQAQVAFPSFNSAELIRDDDAYGVMLKAAEIKDGCFTQDCPALNDIRIQVTTPADDPEIAGIRNRIYHRLFVVYHPLHSLLMVGLDRLGIPFETSFDLINAIAKIMIPLSVAYFVYSVWGPRTAALALLLLAVSLFWGPGIHQVKTHSFVLGASFFLWAGIYRQKSWAIYGLPFFIVAMCLTHPLGNLTSLAAILLFIATSGWPLPRKAIVITGFSLGLTLFFFALPNLVHTPEFGFDPVSFYPGQWNYWANLSMTLPVSLGWISEWTSSFGGIFMAVVLFLVGFFAVPAAEKRKFLMLLYLTLGLGILSIVYVVPWYGDISFTRIWPIVGVVWVSTAAAGLRYLINGLTQIRWPSVSSSSRSRVDWPLLTKAVLGVLIICILGSYFISSISDYFESKEALSQPGKSLNQNQIQIVRSTDLEGANDTILYMDEFAMHYYMTYGGLNYGAIYYPALRRTMDLEFWMQERSADITFVVNQNPMSNIPLTENDGILLRPGESFRVQFDSVQVDRNLYILLPQRTDDTVLSLIYGQDPDDATSFNIKPGPTEWIEIPDETVQSESLLIRVAAQSSPLEIHGIQTSRIPAPTLWPWDQGIALTYEDSAGNLFVSELSSSSLVEPLSLSVTVVDDIGPFVLARVNRNSQ